MTAPDDILTTIGGFIREVIGEEWVDDVAIDLETSFSDDLELESIEFVALAEKMQERFGKQVDFVEWLGTMELGAIIALSVGDVVRFVESKLK